MSWLTAPVWQGFKWNSASTHLHSGIDLRMSVGTPIFAPMAGTIVSSGNEPWGGQVNEQVYVGGRPYVLSWLHLSHIEPLPPGTPVQAGQTLGYSGTPPPGYGSGAHTHFEVTSGSIPPYMGYSPWYPTTNSYPVNPVPFLNMWKNGGVTLLADTSSMPTTTKPSNCVHSVSIFPGQTFCLDAGINFTVRAGFVLAGAVLILAALAVFAAGNSGVQTVVKEALPAAAAAA